MYMGKESISACVVFGVGGAGLNASSFSMLCVIINYNFIYSNLRLIYLGADIADQRPRRRHSCRIYPILMWLLMRNFTSLHLPPLFFIFMQGSWSTFVKQV